MTHDFSGIQGLRGRDPIAAIISVGRKAGPDDAQTTGVPIEKAMWHFLQPRGDLVKTGRGTQEIRSHSPRFRRYNDAPAQSRTTLAVELAHAELPDAYNARLSKQTGPNRDLTPQSGRPFCEGDGKNARRFRGNIRGEEVFEPIVCPNDRCEFRQEACPGQYRCKPFVRLLVRPIWPESMQLPSVLVRYVSRSWNTASNFKGLFDEVRKEAAQYGIENINWYGLPLQLTVAMHGNSKKGRRHPVVHPSVLGNVGDWLAEQAEHRAQLEEKVELLRLTDQSQQDPETIARDAHSVTPSTIQGTLFAGEEGE